MTKHFVFFMVLQLLYFTNSIYNRDVRKNETVFRKDYKFFELTQSFYKVHTLSKSWLDAKKRCVLEGATLWYPDNQAEVDMIIEYWKVKLPTKPIIHIGMSDLVAEGLWETVDGQSVEEVWHEWAEGEPNNSGGLENCAVMKRNPTSDGAVLNDEYCDYSQPFICKKTVATIEWNFLCDMADNSYIYDQTLGKCYKFYKNIISWPDAYSVCASEDSYLAVINSEKEKDFLVKLTADAHTENIPWDHWDIRQVHLGFHRRFGDGWQTVKGEPLEESGYFVWAENQPDNLGDEQCGSMFLNGLYNDFRCDKVAFFICEHDISTNSSQKSP